MKKPAATREDASPAQKSTRQIGSQGGRAAADLTRALSTGASLFLFKTPRGARAILWPVNGWNGFPVSLQAALSIVKNSRCVQDGVSVQVYAPNLPPLSDQLPL